ncbi:MAG: hypothetical protein M0R33_13970 [Methylomonas sp.]|jgi:hypothetical protein|uniref:hypothetical protein n=1 Tax=Methylomonas sp. TaxID=418 RepID=UPI0025F7F5FD|nr:hypothetical protein [Methylomonas sp.]MCK9607543.1 hypothetical protein [Methylomonas sp.]
MGDKKIIREICALSIKFHHRIEYRSNRAIMATADTHEIRKNPEQPKWVCDKCTRSFPTRKGYLLHCSHSRSCGTHKTPDACTVAPPNVFNTNFVITFGKHLFDPAEDDPKKAAIAQIVIRYPCDFYREIKKFLWSFAPDPKPESPPEEFTDIINGETVTERFDTLITNFISCFSEIINQLISDHAKYQIAQVHFGEKYETVIPISTQ